MSVTVIRALLGIDCGFEYVLRKYIHQEDFERILYDFGNMYPKKYPKLITFVNDIETIREIMKNCREADYDNDLKKNLIETSLENVLKIIAQFEPEYVGDVSNSVRVIEFLNELKELYDNDLLRYACKYIPQNGFFIKCFEQKLNECD